MKRVEENGEINEELKVAGSEKVKTESQNDPKIVENTEVKQQQVEETTVLKGYHVISENIINKGMESKMTCNKITYI